MLPDEYAYDGHRISLITADPERRRRSLEEVWIPCQHLAPILSELLERGAVMDSVSTAWSKAELVVTLDRGLAAGATEQVARERSLSHYANNDSHYLVAFGLFCEHCRQGIEWPQATANMKSG